MKGFWKDITWVEIGILLSLLVSLSVLTFPNYELFACRSKQSEVKYVLGQIHSAQHLFYSEHDYFAPLEYLIEQGLIRIKSENYRYFSDYAGKDSFLVLAEGMGDPLIVGDAWMIDNSHNLVNIFNTCNEMAAS